MNKDEDIRRSLRFARSFGLKRRLSDEQAEDLAQQYVIAKYVKKTGQNIEQAYVDFLRVEFGDQRTISGACKSKARRYSKDIDGDVERGTDPFRKYDRYSERCYTNENRERRLKLLTCREEYIVRQLNKSVNLTQIAKSLGITQGRVSQIKDIITQKMLVADLNKVLKVDWITL